MAYDVFVSYANEDINRVNELQEVLDQQGIDIFIAEYSVDPGKSLRKTIFPAIEECDLFILLWSRYSKESDWVSKEIDLARRERKRIIPVMLDRDVKPPGFLADIKYLPAYEDMNSALSWLREHVLTEAQKSRQREKLITLAVVLGLLALIGRDE